LFDSVIEKKCEIRRLWRERSAPALQFFVWQIVFSLVTLAGMVVLVGIPALIAFLLGWFPAPREHLAALILWGILLFFVLVAWFLGILFGHVFSTDFVVPQISMVYLVDF